jgi:hypothetical protein
MKSRPRWIVWMAASVLLWASWVAFAYLPLQRQDQSEEADRAEWVSRQDEMLARIRTAGEVIARLESLALKLDSATQDLPQAPLLDQYMDQLTDLGRVSGVTAVEVNPELTSMMSLSKHTDGVSTALDTLMVEVGAIGGFHAVGMWLDQVELQPAFRHWLRVRWDKGEEPGSVHFGGTAAFLVVVPKGGAS